MRHILLLAAARANNVNAPGALAATRARFDQIDANGDGHLSRAEASAVQPITDMSDVMDIHDGIDSAPFKSRIEAAGPSSTFGRAASGGGRTYQVYPDGHRVRVKPGVGPNSDNRDASNL